MDAVVIVVVVGAVVLVAGGAGFVAAGAVRRRRRTRRRTRGRGEAGSDMVAFVKDAVRVGTQVHALAKELAPTVRDSLQPIVAWARSARPSLRSHVADDGTITLLFSDIESSTAINERLGDERWMDEVRAHTRLVSELAGRNDGRVVKSQGDGFMIAFKRPGDALGFAVGLQRALDETPPGSEPLRVRVGIHRGEAISEDGDYFGSAVAFAARVAAQAEGGEILVSLAVVEGSGAEPGVSFSAPRPVELKGIGGVHQLFSVDWRPT